MLLSQSVRTDTAYVVNPLTKRPMMQLLLWIPRRNAPGRSRCLVATEQHISSIFVPFDNLSVIYQSLPTKDIPPGHVHPLPSLPRLPSLHLPAATVSPPAEGP